mgnify:CR=1 FL=1
MNDAEQGDFWNKSVRARALTQIFDNMQEKESLFILFICGGNICRSPYAEMKFEYMLKQKPCVKKIKVASGGFIKNTTIHRFTRKGLLNSGIKEERISQFHPRPMRKEHKQDLIDSDIILAPTQQVITTLLPKKYRKKAFLFSEVNEGEQYNIEDPATLQEFASYKKILDDIDKYLLLLLKMLEERKIC